MSFERFSFAMLMAAGMLWTIGGCNGSATTNPPEMRTSRTDIEPPASPPLTEPHGQVHVNAGNGRGVHVDVERPSGEKAVDVNVPPRTPAITP